VNRAEAKAVRYVRLALVFDVADDMCRVEQARLLQPADGTSARVRTEHPTAESRLMKSHARFVDAVAPLDRVFQENGIALVERPVIRPGATSTRRAAMFSSTT
jgi:hypothetical protein